MNHTKTYPPCTGCGRPLRPAAVPAADQPGTVRHGGNGRCEACCRRSLRGGYKRRQPAALSRRYRRGDPIQLIQFHRTRDGIAHRITEGAYIRSTAAQWVIDTPEGTLALDRDEWAEIAA